MASKKIAPSSLVETEDSLKSKIQKTDEALHELLVRRVDLSHQLFKELDRSFSSSYEAQSLRSLMALPQGKIPKGLVVRLWREMMSALAFQKKPASVAVYAPLKEKGMRDYARDYFGASACFDEEKTAVSALKSLRDGKVDFAVVPFPHRLDKDNWWPLLADIRKKEKFSIFAITPFVQSEDVGVVLGMHEPELTGSDASFLYLETGYVPEAEVTRLLSRAGYKVRHLFVQNKGSGDKELTLFLAEVDGFITRKDTRVSRLRAMLGSRLKSIALLGAYALPLKK